MKIIVTGGAGFIGSCFVRLALEDPSLEILNLDKLTYAGNLENLDPIAGNPRYRFIKGDICDADLLNTLFADFKPDAVAHFAAESHVDRSILAPQPVFDTNLRGSFNLLEAARAACDRAGAALIFDEIQTGMGRTGTLWAYEQTPVKPDALTSAKALGGGLPIGALITGERLQDTFQPGDHGSTFAGGPVACAAALVALQICSEPAVLASVVRLGAHFAEGLARLPYVSRARGRGLMLAIDLADGVDAPALARRALLEQRLVVNATGPGTIRLEPPLIVTEQEIEQALSWLQSLA